MGVFTNIQAALNTRLSTLPNSPTIQWPNVNFNPNQNNVFIRPTMLPTSGALATVNGEYLHEGLYQIDVFCPLNKGTATLTGWLDAITSLFTATKTLVSGGNSVFIQDVTLGRSERQESWYVGFITIKYICYS